MRLSALPALGALCGLLALLLLPAAARAQVGLRTAPLTAPRVRDGAGGNDSRLGPLSKWTGVPRKNATNHIESSLAAIFRGVAYGVSTLPTTSSTTTPAPPPPPEPTLPAGGAHRGRHNSGRHSHPSSAPPAGDAEAKGGGHHRGVNSVGDSPVQTPFVETDEDGALVGADDGLAPDETGVVRADVGVSNVAWVRELGAAWVVHVYCAAGLYSLLALLALFWLSRVHAGAHLLPRGYYITVQLLMFLAAFLRCVHLFHDPYGAEHRLPETLSAVVEEAGWPCLTAALAAVALAVVRAWRCPRHLPRKHHAPAGLAVLTVTHLVTSVGAHLVAAVLPQHAGALRAAARTVTAAWGGTVGIAGVLGVWRAAREAGRHPAQLLVRLSRSPAEAAVHTRHPRAVLLRGAHLTLAAAFAQVLLAALHMYALVGPADMLALPPTNPWHWLAHQSVCRVLEVLMWLLLGAAAALPVGGSPVKRESVHKSETRLLAAFSCRRCGGCACADDDSQGKDDEVFPTVCQASQAVRNYTLQACGKGVFEESLAPGPPPPLHHHANTTRTSARRSSIRKSATLHSTTSDIHLLWNHQGHAPTAIPVSTASRPSSMLFNDAGFVRFCMQVDPKQEAEDAARTSLQDLEVKSDGPKDAASAKLLGQTPGGGDDDDSPVYERTYANVSKSAGNSPVRAVSPRFGAAFANNFEELKQKRQCAGDVYSGGSEDGHCRSDGASVTDCSSTDAASPAITYDNEWSKYASTCSSISAANSFDVRMYDDFEVASYYHASPVSSSDASHVYATLQRPPPRAVRLARQRALQGDASPPTARPHDAHMYTQEHFMATHVLGRTSSMSPQSDFLDRPSDGRPRASDTDLFSASSHLKGNLRFHEAMERSPGPPRRPPQPVPRRVNLHAMSPEATMVMDYRRRVAAPGEGPDEGGEPTLLVRLGQVPAHQQQPRPGLLKKIVKNNFSLGGGGYSPLSSEDVYTLPIQQQQQQKGPRHPYQPQSQPRRFNDKRERVRPCGHRPRRGPGSRQEPSATSPTTCSPVHMPHKYPGDPVRLLQGHPADQQDFQQAMLMNGKEVEEEARRGEKPPPPPPPRAASASPPSSRPGSSIASHSDLPSECVDSDDEIQSDAAQKHDSEDDEDVSDSSSTTAAATAALRRTSGSGRSPPRSLV
ncbi:uncharacterized protein LOC134779387 [Penaeus indicus]|uniref:uncharacterized protein LOC134779387 n=1 Tax=Penaeus indicus TaxID=29960 RepID=UPI00300D5A26